MRIVLSNLCFLESYMIYFFTLFYTSTLEIREIEKGSKMRAQDLPEFKDIPKVEGMPHGTAWGLWDKNGERDSNGSLNLLTPENTIEAQKEIRTGQGVALK